MDSAAKHHRGVVWIVDDSALEAEMARRALLDRYDVEVVADGPSVLERLSREPTPDLLILDWQLPGMSGIEVCRFLRARIDEMKLPILMLTVQGHKDDIVEGLYAGANDYLTKPYDAAELLARVMTLHRGRMLYDELRAERQRLEEIFSSLPAYVAISSGADHVLRFVNPPLKAFYGGPEPVGRTLSDVFPRLTPELSKLWDEVYAAGESRHLSEIELPIRSSVKGEDAAYFSLSLVPQRDRAGRVDGVLAFAVDTTPQVLSRRKEELAAAERERLLEQAQRAWARAEQANRAKDEFLATVSHELRTPLNAISGWVHLLQHGRVAEGKQQQALETIERNARAQTQLIDDLLDVSRIISGKLSLSIEPINFSSIVEMAIEAVRPSAEAKGVTLTDMLTGDAVLLGDAVRLQQVAWNLLTNAVKFTPRGGQVEVSLRPSEAHFEFCVMDTGQGIEPGFLPLMFDRFRQADSTLSRTQGGLGLGLAIVRHLVELHGGKVTAASGGKNQGAKFIVELPAARVSQVEPGRVTPDGIVRGIVEPSSALRGRTLLVVEDDRDSRELLVKMLEDCGAIVIAVASAPEALHEVEAQRPDAIVSDIGMPDEDGLSLIRKIRALPTHGDVPAVALTAYARAEDRIKTMSAGFNAHLTKPVSEAELLVVLASIVPLESRREQ